MPFVAALPALPTLAIGGGTAISAGSSILSGFQQGAADKDRAIQYSQQAQLDLGNAGRQVQDTETRAVKTIAAGNAAAGGAGVTQSGSPLLAARESINNANANDVYTRYTGKLRSVSDLYQAQLERTAAKDSIFGGFLGAGAAVAKGGLDAYNAGLT